VAARSTTPTTTPAASSTSPLRGRADRIALGFEFLGIYPCYD
jgi:hypothetical protein